MTGVPPRERRTRPGQRAAPTTRGWTLVALGLAALVTGRLLGVAELDGLGAAALVAVLAAWVWAGAQDYRLEARRSLQPPQPAPGRRNAVELRLHNGGSRPTPVLAVHDPFDGSGPRLLLAPLGPGGTRTWRYELPELRRGSFEIGPLVAEARDPFGLARVRRAAGQAGRLVVHPRVRSLRSPVVARASRQEGLASTSQDSDQEFADLREYVDGDDLRRVHWPSSARTGTLLVREDRVERLGRVLVVVDLRRRLWTPPALEAALEAVASVADDALTRGLQVRLVGTDGTDSGLGRGARQRARVLDQLALATPHRGGALLGPGEPAPPGPAGGSGVISPALLAASDHTIVCTSDRAVADDFRGMVGRRRRAPLTVVLVEATPRDAGHPTSGHPTSGHASSGHASSSHASSGHASSGHTSSGTPTSGRPTREAGPALPPGARVVRVGAGRDFASAWNEAAPR